MSDQLAKLLDPRGRVTRWPSLRRNGRKVQQQVLAYLVTKFEIEKRYSEREVNAILKQYHTFSDWALLRRELYDWGYLERTRNGSAYWRPAQSPSV